MIRRPPRSTPLYSSAASDVYKRQQTLYASVSKGYKAGGFNTQMFSDVLQQKLMGMMGIGASYDVDKIVSYKPEKAWNFEVGSHIDCWNHRVKSDIGLFFMDCTDRQLTVFPDGTTTGRVMTNAGKTRSWGCLLYTSPSPRDVEESRMPSSA